MSAFAPERRIGLYTVLALLFCMLDTFSRDITALATNERAARSRGNVPVLTFKYNVQRTGANTNEVTLNTKNVASNRFGKVMSYAVDGQIYAQPLYIPDVNAGGVTRNLVIVATENNSIYAFDADNYGDGSPIWENRFAVNGATTVSSADEHCADLVPNVGITSTPVVANGTLFVVSHVLLNGNFYYHLHALDLRTGQNKAGSPVEVHVPGSNFDPKMQRQRAALLYAYGRIYLGFGSFCDNPPYHGWILSYSYNGRSFTRLASWSDTPGGMGGGIWGSGNPLVADGRGYIYATTGNGSFNLNRGGRDASDSYVKLTANVRVVDYFTPFNQQCQDAEDRDLGSGGPTLLPGNEMTAGTKDGKIYVVNTSNMGGYHAVSRPCQRQQATNLDHVVQELPQHTMSDGVYSGPAYWNGYVYYSGSKGNTKAFRLVRGRLVGPVSVTPDQSDFTGGNPVVSSDGNRAGTGILWLINSSGTLYAYDATNLKKRLYSGDLGSYVKFSVPIVSNGKVFVPTADSLQIFGLQ